MLFEVYDTDSPAEEEIQSFAERKDMKKFHDVLNENLYGPKGSGATTLLSADRSTLLTDKKVDRTLQ